MLSQATNKLLTEVGPSTPMGDYLRRYWHPVAGEAEFQNAAIRPVRVLGEDLVVYRDLSGNFGAMARHCPHRRADLSYGYVESNGLRCNYHGWLFDRQGKCIEQPYDDIARPEAEFKARICTTAYEAQVFAGLVWIYMGSKPAPLIPDWEAFNWSNGFVQVSFAEVPCNWLQCQENAIDPVHLEWMHTNWSIRQSGRLGPYGPRHLKLAFEEFEYGFIYKRITDASSATDDLWTVGRVALWPNGFCPGEHFDWHTPIDDETTLRVTWAFSRVPSEMEPYVQEKPVPAWRGPVKGDDGRWLVERPANQDFVAWVGQGAIADRTQEHLAASDEGVIMLRRRLLAELEAVANGAEPKGLIRSAELNRSIALPGANLEVYRRGLPRKEMFAHPFAGAMIRSYPFQAGEPPEVREAFNAALGLDVPECRRP